MRRAARDLPPLGPRPGGDGARQRHRGGQDGARGGHGIEAFSQFRAHYRFESRYCNPYSGNEKGSVENAVGFLRRNLLVPVPAFGALPELNAFLAEGCARVNAAARCRDGRPHGEAYREDLAAMRALPGVEFDAVRWTASSTTGGWSSSAASPTASAMPSCRRASRSKSVRASDAQAAQFPMLFLLKSS